MVRKSNQKMYKTIRHGENSLQYTILPQTDDIRYESKLKFASRSKKTQSRKQKKRRSFFAYLGVIFICTVIIGTILIPFVLSGKDLTNPKEWFQKTKLAFMNRLAEIASNQSISVANSKTEIPSNHKVNIKENQFLKANVGRTVKIIKKNGIESIILKFNKIEAKPTSEPHMVQRPVLIPLTTHFGNLAADLEATTIITTAATITKNNADEGNILNSGITNTTFNTIKVDSITNSTKNNTNSISRKAKMITTNKPYLSTRYLQAPLLKSADKKSNLIPIQIKYLTTQGISTNISHQVSTSLSTPAIQPITNEKNSSWIMGHWPYIDPSTYFQWNKYKTEDSVLLTVILCFTMIGLILILMICLITRNKRNHITGRQIKRTADVEANGSEDNATLLANTYLSDDD